MKVRVSVFGTFRQRFSDYQPAQGMEVELPDGATVQDLLGLLDLSGSQGALVIAEGRILKTGERLKRGVPVNVMQAIDGG
jgi:sulfur carrier protein ThiS